MKGLLYIVTFFASAFSFSQSFERLCDIRNANDRDFVLEFMKENLEYRNGACQCLTAKVGSCRDLDLWQNELRRELEGNLYLEPLNQSSLCTQYFIEERLGILYSGFDFACRETEAETLKRILSTTPHDFSKDPKGCWKVAGFNAIGCLRWISCSNDKEVISCPNPLQSIELLKNPGRREQGEPIVNYLTHGELHESFEYGAANCHGTVQAILGGLLNDFQVTKALDWSGTPALNCLSKVEAKLEKSKSVKNLSPAGGVVINMDHQSEEPLACGENALVSRSCSENSLTDYVFVKNMSVGCWGRLLEERAGLKRLPSPANWKDLQPGCVLTDRDHSIYLVHRNASMCYYYESTTPFGPSHIEVAPCISLRLNFKRQWCP